MDVTIRAGEAREAARISALILESSARFIFDDFTPEGRERFAMAHSPEAIARLFEQGYRYHIAERGDELVGLVAVRERTHLYHLFVTESAHQQGIGRRLWETALDDVAPGGTACRITVNASRNAVPVYERFGFVASSGPTMRDGVLSVPMVFERPATTAGA